jgi:hypothetical protein
MPATVVVSDKVRSSDNYNSDLPFQPRSRGFAVTQASRCTAGFGRPLHVSRILSYKRTSSACGDR